jgi:hypothetical protein
MLRRVEEFALVADLHGFRCFGAACAACASPCVLVTGGRFCFEFPVVALPISSCGLCAVLSAPSAVHCALGGMSLVTIR